MSGNQAAHDLLRAGLSVIPITMPSKRPTIKGWEPYQQRIPDVGELAYNGAIALICGKVSGNVECFDIDTKHDTEGTLIARLEEAFGDFWEEIQNNVVIQRTVSGGMHFIYRCSEISGNQKLARNAKGEVVLETRGEGGYIVVAPTPGYEILSGDIQNIPEISPRQRLRLFECAAMLNEYFTEKKVPTSKKVQTAAQGLKPWDAYNEGTDVADLLNKHGWTFVKTHGKVEFWKRPGSTDSAWSASWHTEKGTLYVYTSSAPPLEASHAYTPYALFTFFEHNGDFSASAKDLLKQGFGSAPQQRQEVQQHSSDVDHTQIDEPKVLSRVQRIEKWMSDHFEFRRNIITNRLVYRKIGTQEWVSCNENDIWRGLQHNIGQLGKGKRGGEVSVPLNEVCTILESSFVPDYNPFNHYFETLPAWDGQDHITALAGYIQTDNQEFWIAQFKKSLVRMIACTIGHVENRIVMTLIGEKQEVGKSSFIRFLCPPFLREYYKESPMEHNKDADIALSENFIWNLEELADLNKKEIADMKAMISRASIKQRRAYARYEEALPRIVNFWGSTNKVEFLADAENTRWMCFNVVSISHDYHNTQTGVQKIDINRVWAQAWHLYKTGFKYNLDQKDRERRDLINHNFESMPEEKQLIIRYFKPGKSGDGLSKFMINHDVKEHLNQNTSAKNRYNELNIGRAMKQLGFAQEIRTVNKKTVRGYWLQVQNSPIEYDNSNETRQPELFGGKTLNDDGTNEEGKFELF